jgi:hypothetical protein
MVVFILLGFRIWVVLGLGSLVMLLTTDILPPALLGEALFDGVDSFALIAVPLFINIDDIIKVDTRDGKYLERVKKA